MSNYLATIYIIRGSISINIDMNFNELPIWSIFTSAPVPICMVGIDGHFIDVNEKWAEKLGYTREELKTMSYNQITHPEVILGESKEIDSILNNPSKETRSYIKKYITKDGRLLEFKLAFSTINDETGGVTGFVSWMLPIDVAYDRLLSNFKIIWISVALGIINFIMNLFILFV